MRKQLISQLLAYRGLVLPSNRDLMNMLNLKSESHASMILNGKRQINPHRILHLARQLEFKPYETAVLCLGNGVRSKTDFEERTKPIGKFAQMLTSERIKSLTPLESLDHLRTVISNEVPRIFSIAFAINDKDYPSFLAELYKHLGTIESSVDRPYETLDMQFGAIPIPRLTSQQESTMVEESGIGGLMDRIINENRTIKSASIRKMAKAFDISPALLSLVVNEKRTPSRELIEKFADFYEVDEKLHCELHLRASIARQDNYQEVGRYRYTYSKFGKLQSMSLPRRSEKVYWSNGLHSLILEIAKAIPEKLDENRLILHS